LFYEAVNRDGKASVSVVIVNKNLNY